MKYIKPILVSFIVIYCGALFSQAAIVGDWSCKFHSPDKGDGMVTDMDMQMNLKEDNTYTTVTVMSVTSPQISASHRTYAEGKWSEVDGKLHLEGKVTKVEHISGFNMAKMMKGKKDVLDTEFELNNNAMTLKMSKEPVQCSR